MRLIDELSHVLLLSGSLLMDDNTKDSSVPSHTFLLFPSLSKKESKWGINQAFYEPSEPYLLVRHCWYVCMYLCIYTQIHHLLCPSINHSLRILSYDTHTHLRLLSGILSLDLSRHLFHFASILHFGLTDFPSF